MYNVFTQMASRFHADNVHWWTDPATGLRIERNRQEMLFLWCSEIVEAGEGERKSLMDTHLTHRVMAEVEMADVMIRLLDYVGGLRYDIDEAFRRAYPTLNERHQIDSLVAFFRGRFFTRAQRKAEQLQHMLNAVTKVSELEHAGAPADKIANAIAWLVMLVCDYCGTWDYDLQAAILEKHAYNAKRADHTNAARLASGGKKW